MTQSLAQSNRFPEDFGRYRLLSRIGMGGMAEVYLAEMQGPLGFRRKVALKRVLPQLADDQTLVQALVDEARVLGAVVHPNIVQVLDFNFEGGIPFLAMEHVDGGDLGRLLRGVKALGQPLSGDYIATLMIHTAHGLEFAHNAVSPDGVPLNLIHRDLKPSNLLLSFDGQVKIGDFGIAKAAGNLVHTQQHVLKGSLPYMSPEQARGEQPLTPATDQFSLGCVLFELLLLERLYQGQSPVSLLGAVLHGPDEMQLDALLELSPSLLPLGEVARRLLQVDPDQRFPNMADLAECLEALPYKLLPQQQLAFLATDWLSVAEMTQDETPQVPPTQERPQTETLEGVAASRRQPIAATHPAPDLSASESVLAHSAPAPPAQVRSARPSRDHSPLPQTETAALPAQSEQGHPDGGRKLESQPATGSGEHKDSLRPSTALEAHGAAPPQLDLPPSEPLWSEGKQPPQPGGPTAPALLRKVLEHPTDSGSMLATRALPQDAPLEQPEPYIGQLHHGRQAPGDVPSPVPSDPGPPNDEPPSQGQVSAPQAETTAPPTGEPGASNPPREQEASSLPQTHPPTVVQKSKLPRRAALLLLIILAAAIPLWLWNSARTQHLEPTPAKEILLAIETEPVGRMIALDGAVQSHRSPIRVRLNLWEALLTVEATGRDLPPQTWKGQFPRGGTWSLHFPEPPGAATLTEATESELNHRQSTVGDPQSAPDIPHRSAP